MKIQNIYIATLFSIKNSYYYSVTKNVNGIIQINGSYSALKYDKTRDLLRYGTKSTKKSKVFIS